MLSLRDLTWPRFSIVRYAQKMDRCAASMVTFSLYRKLKALHPVSSLYRRSSIAFLGKESQVLQWSVDAFTCPEERQLKAWESRYKIRRFGNGILWCSFETRYFDNRVTLYLLFIYYAYTLPAISHRNTHFARRRWSSIHNFYDPLSAVKVTSR